MGFSLIPKEEKFYELFDQQAAHGVEATKLFRELVSGWRLDSPLFDKLRDIEHEADITCHEIIDRLNRTFITPFDREDIHRLASELDDVVDLVQSLSSRMKLYHVERTTEDLVALADILVQAAEQVRKAIVALHRRGEGDRRLLDHCIEINRLENAGDRALEIAIGKLFQGKPDPIELIKWKEIYEELEFATDRCEDVANTIEGIAVKQG